MPKAKETQLSDRQFERRIDAILSEYRQKMERLRTIQMNGEYVMVKTWRKPYTIKKTHVAGGHVYRLKKVGK